MKKVLVYLLTAMVVALSYSVATYTHDQSLDQTTALKVDAGFSILMSLACLFLVLFPSRMIVGLLATCAFASSYAFNTTLPTAPIVGASFVLVLLLMGLTGVIQRMQSGSANPYRAGAIFQMTEVHRSNGGGLPAKPTH